MDLPTTVVTAVALSAAAGKNPWIPLGALLLLGAPESVPEFIIDKDLQAGLHELLPSTALYILGSLFLVVSLLESLAHKIPQVEQRLHTV
ncbi:MAG: hypothetical protein AAGF12_09685 [Myxococcota bacterium]